MIRKTTVWLLVMLVLIFSVTGAAAADLAPKADLAHLIDIAGKQRMLSQKIAKAYFFLGQGIRKDKTRQQLYSSLEEFSANLDVIKAQVNMPEIQDMLVYIEMAKQEMAGLVKKPYDNRSAALVLDYSEALLEGSQDIVTRLEGLSKKKKEHIVNTAGRQRMLTQRIAKYYIAYQAGFKDHNTVEQLHQAVSEFEEAQRELRSYKRNTPQIAAKLSKVNNLWRVVSRFYKNVKTGGLPVIVLSTTDHIMDTMNEVTHLYVALLQRR